MQTFEIKNRWNGKVLFSAGGESLRDVVQQAAQERANLRSANLRSAGCFFDTIEAFRAAVVAEHADNNHGREYMAAIAMIEAHAAIWSSAAVAVKEVA